MGRSRGTLARNGEKRPGLARPVRHRASALLYSSAGSTRAGGRRGTGGFAVVGQTIRKRLQAKLSEVKAELRRRLHDPIPAVGTWLRQGVGGQSRLYRGPQGED